MRKRTRISICIILVLVSVCLTSCKEEKQTKQKKTEENHKQIEAMYVPCEEDNYIFFDRSTESPFYAIIPEDKLYDAHENKIKKKDLGAGDILVCYGDGKMLQSYPGQYPGVTKMVRIKKGTVADTEKYQQEVAKFLQRPSKADIPYMDIENMQKNALVTTSATEGNYEWKYEDMNGKQQMEKVEDRTFFEKEGLAEIVCNGENSDLKLLFSVAPNYVKVMRYSVSTAKEKNSHGQRVRVVLDENIGYIKRAKKSCIYEVIATWDNGKVHYGFYIP
ncbi:hypothetical protein [Faecalimonas sp.]